MTVLLVVVHLAVLVAYVRGVLGRRIWWPCKDEDVQNGDPKEEEEEEEEEKKRRGVDEEDESN